MDYNRHSGVIRFSNFEITVKALTIQKPFTVVIGLGPTGLACVRHLIKRGLPVAVTDNREKPPCLERLKHIYPDIEVVTGEFSKALINRAEQIVVSPGVSCKELFIATKMKKEIPVVGDIELFARENKVPVLAITGSNGKTTVTTMLGQMIEKSGHKVEVCGNIGQQVLALLDKPKPDYYVMELSSFQLETTRSLKPKAAVILNVTPDHMDRYDDISGYMKAKQNIYHDCDIAVVNADEPEIWKSLELNNILPFSLQEPRDNEFGLRDKANETYLAHGATLLLPVKKLALQGQHHYQNALATLAMGSAIGLPMKAMLSVLQTFEGIPHRCQMVAEKKGIRWINDSKGTNAGASVAAIQSVGLSQTGKLLLIAGGDAKQADLSSLREPVSQFVEQVYLFGQDADALQKVLDGVATCHRVASLEEAVSKAAMEATQGDTVLLSPACASFDMFDGYEHRGRTFIKLVSALEND